MMPVNDPARRGALRAMSALAVLAALPGPRSAWAAEGPVLDELLSDPARGGRTLPVKLRLPTGDGPWPWVIHSHGLGGSRDGAAAWGHAWAGAGVAVLHVQHPGSDRDTLRAGLRALRAAASAEQLLARVGDVAFVLDEVTRRARSGGLWAQLRADAVGVSGHSFGAHTVQAVAGQRFAGAAAVARDPRPRAFVAFSPSPGARADTLDDARRAFGGVTRPFFALTGSLDTNPLADHGPQHDDGRYRTQVYEGLPAGDKALLWLEGADHASFGGGTGMPAPAMRRRDAAVLAAEPAHQSLIAGMTALWWRWRLSNDATAEETLRALAHGQVAGGLGPVVAPDRFMVG
ncbi:MAG: dienelactone hydrolase [Rhodoferax sp.]|nr:dienelactone hydrolase [Rhodoferax sp.]